MSYKIHYQSVFEKWPIDDKSVQAIITSPPYYSLRKYDIPDIIIGGNKDCDHVWGYTVKERVDETGFERQRNSLNKFAETLDGNKRNAITENIAVRKESSFCINCGAWRGQYGLEPNYKFFIDHTMLWIKEVHRVLKDDGVFFLNMGDSYPSGGGKAVEQSYKRQSAIDTGAYPDDNPSSKLRNNMGKCKLMIPHRIAINMIDSGDWILRNDIIWEKGNSLPESVKDRYSNKTENIFMFVKKKNYYFNLDAVRVPWEKESILRLFRGVNDTNKYNTDEFGQSIMSMAKPRPNRTKDNEEIIKNIKYNTGEFGQSLQGKITGHSGYFDKDGNFIGNINGKNPGNVWHINTQPSKFKHYACVTPDTEILTIEGWKKYTDIQWYKSSPKYTLVATYNLQKQMIEYQKLSYIKEYDFDGELIHVGNSSLDILMTPNHRNVVKKQNGKEIIVLAEDLSHMDKIRVSAPIINYPENNGIGITLSELIGYIISEGHYKKGGYIEIYQQENKYQCDRIDYLLKTLEIPNTKYSRKRLNTNKKLITWYLKKCPLVNWIIQNIPPKKLTPMLISLPINEIRTLFSGLIAGDGHIRKDDGRICFVQKNIETCGYFQILALRLGFNSILTTMNKGSVHCVFLTTKEFIGIRGTNGKDKSIKKVKYQGKIWCPKTPNGTWVARRNGRVFITGNSWPQKLAERMVLCSTKEGDIILDPFAGSGNTLKVAIKNNREAIGIDLGYNDIQEENLKNIQTTLL